MFDDELKAAILASLGDQGPALKGDCKTPVLNIDTIDVSSETSIETMDVKGFPMRKHKPSSFQKDIDLLISKYSREHSPLQKYSREHKDSPVRHSPFKSERYSTEKYNFERMSIEYKSRLLLIDDENPRVWSVNTNKNMDCKYENQHPPIIKSVESPKIVITQKIAFESDESDKESTKIVELDSDDEIKYKPTMSRNRYKKHIKKYDLELFDDGNTTE